MSGGHGGFGGIFGGGFDGGFGGGFGGVFGGGESGVRVGVLVVVFVGCFGRVGVGTGGWVRCNLELLAGQRTTTTTLRHRRPARVRPSTPICCFDAFMLHHAAKRGSPLFSFLFSFFFSRKLTQPSGQRFVFSSFVLLNCCFADVC